MLAVRTAGDPLSFTSAVRDQVQALDRDQAMADVRTMDDLVEEQVGQRRLLMMLLGSFAGVAVLLALIGNLWRDRVLGGAAHSGGGHPARIGRAARRHSAAGDGARLCSGSALGVPSAWRALSGLTRLMESLLFHVSATDPATFAGVALLFLCVALAASYIPARRAARIDPMAALRIH